MKLGITGKLFLVILATNAAIAIALGIAERVSFDSGFRDYMREREGERLTAIAAEVAKEWNPQSGFEALRGNESQWRRHVRAAFGAEFGPRPDGEPPMPPGMGRPGGRPPDGFGGRPPDEPGGPPPDGPGFDGPPPRGPGGPGGPGGPFPRNLPSLLDAQKRTVVGTITADQDPVMRPVSVNGTTVGWVAGLPLQAPFTGAERRLSEQQAKAGIVIAAFAVLLAAIVGYLLARGLIRPVKRLAAATHRIAAGDYATRVESTRRDELGQLTADFNRLAGTLERNELQRRHFMADISHELRTPLAILRGELEALEDGIRTLTPDRLRSLQAEVATLGKLVDDLYDLSLTDVGALTYHKQRIDLREVVDAAVLAFGERFAQRQLSIECVLPDAPVAVDADARRITQVLNNLLENSARYTNAGGRVRVEVAHSGPYVNVDVVDSEPAVPEDALPRLFDRLYRVDASRNRKSGGAGLGLALAKGIVEGHGGEIAAQQSPLGGLWIRVTLPAA